MRNRRRMIVFLATMMTAAGLEAMLGPASSARAQSTACEGGRFEGNAGSGYLYNKRAEAANAAKDSAAAVCSAFCAPLDSCSDNKPYCKGIAKANQMTCNFGCFFTACGWNCSTHYTCTCSCSRGSTSELSDGTVSAAEIDRPFNYRSGTRSITACDPVMGECGVAVVSFPSGTPSVVPVGEPGVAVANQAWPNYPTARRIVEAVLAGTHPTTALENALADDPNPDERAFGVAALWPDSPSGVAVATHMGRNNPRERCVLTGDTYTVQADIQTSSAVCQAMADGFEAAQGCLARRLLAALKAGTAVGTDFRGEYSAAVRVFQNTSIFGQQGVSFIGPDASVDRARDWQGELEFNLASYIAGIHEGYAADLVPLTPAMEQDILTALKDLGYYNGPINRGWSNAAEHALHSFGWWYNMFYLRGTVEADGQRLIDAPLAAYIVEGNRRGVLRPK